MVIPLWRILWVCTWGLLLGACSHPQPRVGPPVSYTLPQAAEQCHAQPDLPWCLYDPR